MQPLFAASTRRCRMTWPPGYATTTLLLAVLLAAVLSWMGREPWCNSGFGIWTWQSAGPCTSQHLGDPYSFTHVTHGFILYGLTTAIARRSTLRGRYFLTAAIETSWEILENTSWVIDHYREQTAAIGYVGDSILNSVGDLLCCAIGFALAARLPARVIIALAIGMELVLLVTIRDNLILNVLTIIFPLAELQQWQLQ